MIQKVFWDITYVCNANCLYCFTDSQNDLKKMRQELEISQNKIIANHLIDNDIKKISFGGGEPFIKKDFIELCNYINGKVNISITSNGSILNKDILELLENTMIKLTISLDTINKEKFESIRRGINFNKVIENIKELASYSKIRKRLSIRCTVTNITMQNVSDLIYFCQSLKIPKLKINTTNLFGRANLHKELIPQFKDFQLIIEQLKKNTDNIRNIKLELPCF